MYIYNTETCRPCRYYVTNTGRVIGGSEVGVLEIPEETVIQKGRLLPGKMFLIDFAQGKMVSDEEYKAELIAKRSVLCLSSSLRVLWRGCVWWAAVFSILKRAVCERGFRILKRALYITLARA
jgi:hypothetical protein